MSDLISRQAAIDAAKEELDNGTFYDIPSKIEYLPFAQPTQSNTPNALTALDCISRQAAIDVLEERLQAGGYSNVALVSELNRSIGYLMHLPSAQQKQRWITCSERLPEDLEEVNVTWVNHSPEPYYDFVKDKPFTATAVYYKEKWYWYSSTCADLLAEYGRNPNQEIDDDIEIIAWMPLPEPYKEGEKDDN